MLLTHTLEIWRINFNFAHITLGINQYVETISTDCMPQIGLKLRPYYIQNTQILYSCNWS